MILLAALAMTTLTVQANESTDGLSQAVIEVVQATSATTEQATQEGEENATKVEPETTEK